VHSLDLFGRARAPNWRSHAYFRAASLGGFLTSLGVGGVAFPALLGQWLDLPAP
jgi:hypothetical protein